jgi:hypothetical protein
MNRNYLKIICALVMSYGNAFSQISTDSLVAWYPFNGNANDTSGYGFNGILYGQSSVVGKCAGAYHFTGNYISCGDPPGNEFDLVNDASISLWFKLYNTPPQAPPSGNSGYFTLIGKDVGPGNYNKWFLAIFSNQLVFHINAFNQGNGFWANQAVTPFALNTFYHVVLTKTANTYKFYVNGVLAGSQVLSHNIVDVLSPLKIGDLQDGSSTLNAAIDEVMIFRRALPLSEINQIYVNCVPVVITSVGAIRQNEQPDLKIYPNPSSGKFVLSFNDRFIQVKNLSVYNITGEKIFAIKPQINNQVLTMDLGVQPKGVYLLRVQTRKKIITRKIIVE